ncbi:MAG: PHB depolymerase family esterase [Pseudomonadota bacterium]
MSLRLAVLLGLGLCLALLRASPGLACGGESRCAVPEGYYLALPPPDWDGVSPLGLVVFFHGWNSSPEGMTRNRALTAAVHRRGAMLILPWAQTGYWRQIGPGRAEPGRDEAAYVRAVMQDVAARWPIDPARRLASGFSRGASLVWNLACYTGELFTAFAPIAGGFWRTTPDECPSGPATLRHIHGTADRVVAFDRQGVYNSAPIPDGFALLAGLAQCAGPGAPVTQGKLTCRDWTACATGRALQLCLHDGGHSIPAEWVAEGYDWMIGLTPKRGED